MIEYVPFHQSHVALVDPQPGQDADREFLLSSGAWAILSGTTALSGFSGALCLGCAGVVPNGPGQALVWALLSKHAGGSMLSITRKVLRVLQAHPCSVVEATCDPGHPERARWVEALGFECTGVKRRPHPDHPEAYVYRRVKCGI